MGEIEFYRTEMTANDGTPVRLVYDQQADILEIFFGENEPATGIDLTDYIVLRLNKQTRRVISLMLIHFSILTERTEYGPRSYSLEKLDELSEELRELVLHLLTLVPVSQFLKLSHFYASPTEQTLFAYVEARSVTAAN